MKDDSGIKEKAFVDTNILVYASLAPKEPKSEIARALFSKQCVLSVQVLNEFTYVARQKMKQEWGDIETAVDRFVRICSEPMPLTYQTHILAVKLSKRYRYTIFDSLILASATEAYCNVVYSEDMQNGQRIGNIVIQNPFLV